jgi:hypothetical protein
VRLGRDDVDYESVVERHVHLEDLAYRLGAISAFEFLEIEKTYGRQ